MALIMAIVHLFQSWMKLFAFHILLMPMERHESILPHLAMSKLLC